MTVDKRAEPYLERFRENLEQPVKAKPTTHVITADQPVVLSTAKAVVLDDELTRREHIQNDILEKDQELKIKTLNRLFWYLGVETGVIFLLAFLQGFKWWGFRLEEWSFRLVTAVTIGQITAMLTIAVKHLFPSKDKGGTN